MSKSKILSFLEREIDNAVKPPLPKSDAIDILEDLITHCQVSIDALREEMNDDEGDAKP